MYINNKTAKFGIVSIGIDRNSYRLRFVYLKKRHSLTIGKVSDECFKIALAKAQEINSDILMERFDKTLAKYSPRHAQALETANKPKNLKDIWEHYNSRFAHFFGSWKEGLFRGKRLTTKLSINIS